MSGRCATWVITRGGRSQSAAGAAAVACGLRAIWLRKGGRPVFTGRLRAGAVHFHIQLSSTHRKTRLVYSALFSMNILAASELAGESGFGSVSKDCNAAHKTTLSVNSARRSCFLCSHTWIDVKIEVTS